MENVSLISGIVELVLAFCLALGVAYGSFRLFSRMNRAIDEVEELKKNNVAVAILHAAMMISAAVIVRQALDPAISSLQTALFQGITVIGALKVIGLIAGYLVITITVAIGLIGFSTWIFLRLTRNLDELEAIKSNNVAVAIVLGAVLFIMSLFLANGVESFLSSLIPYPEFESIQIMGE